jgi:hypothetical protein
MLSSRIPIVAGDHELNTLSVDRLKARLYVQVIT